MRTFLLFLPLRLLRNELLAGTFAPLFCRRDSDEVDDEKDEAGVALRRRGSELVRGPSFTFNLTLNILGVSLLFQCQQVSRLYFTGHSSPSLSIASSYQRVDDIIER